MISTMRPCLVLVLVALSGSVCALQDEKKQPSASMSSGSWNSTGDQWTSTSDYQIEGYAPRPDESTLQSMRVQWEQPVVDPLGNFCTIRGQLQIPADNPEPMKPIEWFQGLTVYMARQPAAKPNWSRGITEQDALEHTTVVQGSGTFEVSLDLRKAVRDRQAEQSFQFGLAWARHSVLQNGRQRVEWSSNAPVVASSIEMLNIPAGPPLSRELELINSAAGWPFSNPDGVALIRAVNALQKLPKDEALRVLEEFISLTNDFEYFDDQEVVFWIVRLLFEPVRLDERIPTPMIAVYLVGGEFGEDFADAYLWPLNPMELVDDIPFMVGMRFGMGGMPEHPSSHIEWARRHCVMRDAPLRPTNNPLAAADKLLNSRKFARLNEDMTRQSTELIRAHAMAMVASNLQPLPERRRDRAEAQADWEERRKEAAKVGVKWDEAADRFAVTRPDNE